MGKSSGKTSGSSSSMPVMMAASSRHGWRGAWTMAWKAGALSGKLMAAAAADEVPEGRQHGLGVVGLEAGEGAGHDGEKVLAPDEGERLVDGPPEVLADAGGEAAHAAQGDVGKGVPGFRDRRGVGVFGNRLGKREGGEAAGPGGAQGEALGFEAQREVGAFGDGPGQRVGAVVDGAGEGVAAVRQVGQAVFLQVAGDFDVDGVEPVDVVLPGQGLGVAFGGQELAMGEVFDAGRGEQVQQGEDGVALHGGENGGRGLQGGVEAGLAAGQAGVGGGQADPVGGQQSRQGGAVEEAGFVLEGDGFGRHGRFPFRLRLRRRGLAAWSCSRATCGASGSAGGVGSGSTARSGGPSSRGTSSMRWWWMTWKVRSWTGPRDVQPSPIILRKTRRQKWPAGKGAS